MSALLCDQVGCDGNLVPGDTLNMATDWTCDNCDQVRSATHVRNIMKSLELEAESLKKDDISSLKSLVLKYSSKLHRNHTLLVELKQLLVSGNELLYREHDNGVIIDY